MNHLLYLFPYWRLLFVPWSMGHSVQVKKVSHDHGLWVVSHHILLVTSSHVLQVVSSHVLYTPPPMRTMLLVLNACYNKAKFSKMSRGDRAEWWSFLSQVSQAEGWSFSSGGHCRLSRSGWAGEIGSTELNGGASRLGAIAVRVEVVELEGLA